MKLFVSLLAVMAVASAAMAAPITSVSVAEYSGRLGSSWDAPKSIDGSTSTFWYSEISATGTPYIVYAFDAVYQVDEAVITMDSGNYRKLASAAMSVSTDGVNFTPVGTFAVDYANGAVTTIDMGEASAMYVRLDGVGAYYSNWSPQETTPGNASDGKYAISFAEIAFSDVPEPATIGLLIAGGAALLRRRRA